MAQCRASLLACCSRRKWRYSRPSAGRRGVSPSASQRRAAHSVLPALTLGGLYFAVMLVRLVLGPHGAERTVRWFASPIPTVFHLVLAAFVLVYGHFHYVHADETARGPINRNAPMRRLGARAGGRLLPYLHYPVVVTATFALFAVFRSQGCLTRNEHLRAGAARRRSGHRCWS